MNPIPTQCKTGRDAHRIWLILVPILFLPFGMALYLDRPMEALLLPVAITVVVGALYHPVYLVYGLTLYVAVEEFAQKWIPSGAPFIAARYGGEVLLLLVAGHIAIRRIRGTGWRRTPIDAAILLLFGATLLSAAVNAVPPLTVSLGMRPLVRYVALFYILAQGDFNRTFPRSWMSVCFVMGACVSGIGLLQAIIGAPMTDLLIAKDIVIGDDVVREGLRHIVSPRTYIFSTMGRYDALGVYLSLFLITSFGMQFVGRQLVARWARRFMIFGIPAILLTFSRQSWLALMVGVAFMCTIATERAVLKFRLLLLIVLAAIGATVILFWEEAHFISSREFAHATMLSRLLEPFSGEYVEVSRYSHGRLYVIMEVGPRLLQIAPFCGLGPGQFGSLTSRFLELGWAHILGIPENSEYLINDVNWISILGQLGIMGCLAFLWVLLSLLRYAVRVYRYSNDALLRSVSLAYAGVVLAAVVLGFFGPNFEIRQFSFYFWALGGVIVQMARQDQSPASAAPLVTQ